MASVAGFVAPASVSVLSVPPSMQVPAGFTPPDNEGTTLVFPQLDAPPTTPGLTLRIYLDVSATVTVTASVVEGASEVAILTEDRVVSCCLAPSFIGNYAYAVAYAVTTIDQASASVTLPPGEYYVSALGELSGPGSLSMPAYFSVTVQSGLTIDRPVLQPAAAVAAWYNDL